MLQRADVRYSIQTLTSFPNNSCVNILTVLIRDGYPSYRYDCVGSHDGPLKQTVSYPTQS